MKPFAVIRIGGKQYIVEEGTRLVVDHLQDEEGKTVTFNDVLLYANGEKDVRVGMPNVKDASVTAKIVKHGKEDKVRVARFRAKSRTRKVRGFRASVTALEVTAVNVK